MGKAKKTKSNTGYTAEALQGALEAVKTGMAVSRAAKKYNIPKTTLSYKNKGLLAPTISRRGPSCILGVEHEKSLIQWLLDMSQCGFPITREQLLNSVQMLLNQLKQKETVFKNNRPGAHWYRAFKARNKTTLTEKVIQNLKGRKISATEANLRKWFANVKSQLETKELLDIEESRVFSCDEAAIYLNPKNNKALLRLGDKADYNFINNHQKECLTMMICGNAKGQLAPPMVVFPYSRNIPAKITKDIPSDWIAGKSENGWVDCDSCFDWVRDHFHPWLVRNNIKFPIVLYLDACTSHLTFSLSNLCKKKGIILVALYPHSSHIIQPINIGVFCQLSDVWKGIVDQWREEHEGNHLRRENFASLLQKAIRALDVEKLLTDAFRSTGLYPFSMDAVDFRKNSVDSSSIKPDFMDVQGTVHVPEYLAVLEECIGDELLEEFRAVVGDEWTGLEKHTSLFSVWQKMTRMRLLEDFTGKNFSEIKVEEDRTEMDFETGEAV
ncbi:uncharacterized protein LOC107045568 [Diachasma alloeum]|uniref:uncharacterized protein LOC107045568 n=1 Tax=Diachasma alloeum TaxID=454923 RepID=UPI00073849FC|nr:uncharacterized protein LOC107045568 [Diachasma alloeum]